MFAKRLHAQEDIARMQNLLFDVYIQELGWKFDEKNPSGLRVARDPDRDAALVDNFDSFATFFGVYDRDLLIGGARLIPCINGKLEFEHYHSRPELLRNPGLKLMEINRLVIKPSHQASVAPVLLFKSVAEYLAAHPVDYLVAAVGEPEPAGLCIRLGFEPTERQSFRYSKNDPMPVRLHHLNCSKTAVMEKIITLCERLAG